MYSFEFIVYVVINKKIKDYLKSNVEKEILIKYDDDIIYRVYISISQKIERVKNLDIYDHKSTSKINIEFDENLIESIVDSTMMNFSAIHIKLTTKKQEIQFQIFQNIDISLHIEIKSSNIIIQKSMTSQQQKNSQKISQKYATMRSNRKTTQVDFSMNSIVYSVITSVIFIVFHLTMRELLAN